MRLFRRNREVIHRPLPDDLAMTVEVIWREGRDAPRVADLSRGPGPGMVRYRVSFMARRTGTITGVRIGWLGLTWDRPIADTVAMLGTSVVVDGIIDAGDASRPAGPMVSPASVVRTGGGGHA